MCESSNLVVPAASKSWITEMIRPDPVGDEIGPAIAYEYPKTRFYMGTIVEKRPLCSCSVRAWQSESGLVYCVTDRNVRGVRVSMRQPNSSYVYQCEALLQRGLQK